MPPGRVGAGHAQLADEQERHDGRNADVDRDPRPRDQQRARLGAVVVEAVEMQERRHRRQGREDERGRYRDPRGRPFALRCGDELEADAGQVAGAEERGRQRWLDRPGEVVRGPLGEQREDEPRPEHEPARDDEHPPHAGGQHTRRPRVPAGGARGDGATRASVHAHHHV